MAVELQALNTPDAISSSGESRSTDRIHVLNFDSFFLHPRLDVWFLGAGSLLMAVIWWLGVIGGINQGEMARHFLAVQSQSRWSEIASFLSYWVNWPHFMVSYWILYIDGWRQGLWRLKRFWWAAVVVPVFLATAVGWIVSHQSVIGAGLFIHLMFITVGWHYVKQVYGVIVVDAFKKGYHLNESSRRWLLAHLYGVWGLHYFWANGSPGEFQFYGITYFNPGFPSFLVKVMGLIVVVTSGGLLLELLRLRYWLKRWPSAVASAAFVALHVWFFATRYIPELVVMVPFFHSLQYLWMVWAFQWKTAHLGWGAWFSQRAKNLWQVLLSSKWPLSSVTRHLTLRQGIEGDSSFLEKFGRWHVVAFVFGICIALGYAAFWKIPVTLSEFSWGSQVQAQWGSLFWVGFFQAFINIHHYFIDNVIWRKDTPGLIL